MSVFGVVEPVPAARISARIGGPRRDERPGPIQTCVGGPDVPKGTYPHKPGATSPYPPWLRDLPLWGEYVYDLLLDGEVMYVGYSGAVRTRIRKHLYKRGHLDGVTLHGPFEWKREAEAFEEARIAELRPPWNIAGVIVPYSNLRSGR